MSGRGAVADACARTGIATTAMAEIVHAVLSPEEFALFASFANQRSLRDGDCLFRRGHRGSSMFVIAEGAIELDFGEDLVMKRLGPNEFFGELGLLIGDHLRSADARATCDTEVLELGHVDFHRLVESEPDLVAYFLRRTIMRVVGNEQALISQLRRRNHDLETALDNLYVTTHQLSHTRELVRTDELTGLHNRRGLALYLQECRGHEEGPAQGLLLIDCDRFKQINDQFGHQAGDRVLQSVANILRSMAGADDLACRLGGDEFCLLLRRANAQIVQHAAEFVLSAVHGLLERSHGTPHVCHLSIGASLVDATADWSEWYANADRALYQAKRDGGDRLRWVHDVTDSD
ncbi:GGDEF domain-containing protein [Stenotrophomonas sp. CFBP 13725]|uniref:GGDEF domain-containing protein n=1 Tax=Stenotrophomonas sp. CFBP 13725 TaxID=2775297 RepID=UPI0017829287|nr:GGDEF domain-containing protein [Stenotrophomonas sp. CFBP 13725]MBD8637485.1 GGDEF domain-containing protein [Stenotrophomonas sp. CFBP 13725]